jgi:hypothetical protein
MSDMAIVIVERSFDEPVQFGEIQAIANRGVWCLEMYGVRYVRSFFSTDRRRMICLYEAPDADSVREAQRKAGVPFERAWAASIIEK